MRIPKKRQQGSLSHPTYTARARRTSFHSHWIVINQAVATGWGGWRGIKEASVRAVFREMSFVCVWHKAVSFCCLQRHIQTKETGPLTHAEAQKSVWEEWCGEAHWWRKEGRDTTLAVTLLPLQLLRLLPGIPVGTFFFIFDLPTKS